MKISKAAVIGLGYVGLPLAVEIAKTGQFVYGIDKTPEKVALVNKGVSYIGDVKTSELKELVEAGKIKASTDFDVLEDADAISICVPTPLRKTRDPDISYIVAAVEEIYKRLRKGQLIILESTTYPGTTDEVLLPEFEKKGLKVGKDFFLAFSPERVDPGNKFYNTKNTPKVVGGVTPACLKAVVDFYGKVFERVVPVSSTKSAEMVKLLENTFRSVNIGLVNEMALMCNKLGIDVWEIIEAAATKPFGFLPFYPGPGLGGHCIPIDPLYLSWKLRALKYNAKFIELASEINASMPMHVIQKISDALNEEKKSVKGSKILVLGAAYKKDISDLRESPALDVIMLLKEKGAEVFYNDPFIPEIDEGDFRLKSTAITPENISSMDCLVIITDHAKYNIKKICSQAKLIVDARNATKNIKTGTKIVKI